MLQNVVSGIMGSAVLGVLHNRYIRNLSQQQCRLLLCSDGKGWRENSAEEGCFPKVEHFGGSSLAILPFLVSFVQNL